MLLLTVHGDGMTVGESPTVLPIVNFMKFLEKYSLSICARPCVFNEFLKLHKENREGIGLFFILS